MNSYGIKIKNIEASTLWEYNHGVRNHYEYTNSMFTNSLFLDYLMEHGLKIQKDNSTKDLICLEFHYGSRSYEEEQKHLKTIAKKARLEYKLAKSQGYQKRIMQKKNKRKRIASLYIKAQNIQDSYIHYSKEELREMIYRDGINIEYLSRKRNGEIKKREQIHYNMLYRSTGKAKKGSCMFLCDRLYKRAIPFLHMGIQLPENHAPLVEISAYAPLIASTIVGKIQIDPKNILILKDVDRSFSTSVISIETDENKHCITKFIQDYPLKNTLFDGQALIDSSLFPNWGNGYILLRHHFCKMAAFHTEIQTFFHDYFGNQYETATIQDMFGIEHNVRDIQLITTDNAMKWLKFGVSYEEWCDKVSENKNQFGIVKTAHESKLGKVQKMSYQMVNSLDLSIMEQVVQNSITYVNQLKQDSECFLQYLEKNKNFSNDYEVLIALCRQNSDFIRSSYFRRRKRKIIENYVFQMKTGKLLQDAENLVIVGSPYAMLLYAATGQEESVDGDITFHTEPGTIQCYTERFPADTHLAFFRSPFNSKNNLTYLHNVSSEILSKYFHFGKQIIAVNLIGTDFQDRNNGSDQDSDSGYTTDQEDIVAYAKQCYAEYPTIVNNIPMDPKIYQNTGEEYARLDNELAGSQLNIGESSNLAQIAQTYACNFSDPKFMQYVCILAVLAQVAIDNAKRRYDINLGDEIRRIKNDMDIKTHRYPSFWHAIKKNVPKEHVNEDLQCPMNYLYQLNLSEFHHSDPTLPMSHFFKKFPMKSNIRTCRKVEDLIAEYSIHLYQYHTDDDQEDDDYLLLRSDFDDLIAAIRKIKISQNYLGLFSWMIDRCFKILPGSLRNQKSISSKVNKNKAILLKVLYEINPENLLRCFSKNT